MPTLNNKLTRAKSSLIQLRDEFSRRAKGLEGSFPDECQELFNNSRYLDKIIEALNRAQTGCNLGDRFEIFNK